MMTSHHTLNRRRFLGATVAATAGATLLPFYTGRGADSNTPPSEWPSTDHFWYRLQPAGRYIDSQRGNKAFAYADGKIFLSEDNGKSWNQVLEKDQHIHDITFDNRNKTFYACGFNGSAYHSEDRGEKWTRIRGYNFKWGKRVDPDPRDPEKIFIITFGGGVWFGPAKGDENSAEDILTPCLVYK